MPASFGVTWALRLSEWTHLGWLLWLGTGMFLALLIYQHLLVKANDLSRVNLAFFTTNGVASLLFGTMAIIDLLT